MRQLHTDIPLKKGYWTDRLYQILGLSLITSGVILNEWVIKFLSSEQVKFAETEKRIFLIIAELLLALLGVCRT